MSVFFLICVVVGLALLLAWPMLARRRRSPRRTEQPSVGHDPVPPAHPTETVPGSAPHRHRQGKP